MVPPCCYFLVRCHGLAPSPRRPMKPGIASRVRSGADLLTGRLTVPSQCGKLPTERKEHFVSFTIPLLKSYYCALIT